MESNRQKRVTQYDWIRIIATIYVVIGHSAYLHIETLYGGIDYRLPDNLNPIYHSVLFGTVRMTASWVYGFHMPLFFFLSGAVLHLKAIGKLNQFISRKLKRLLVPYLFTGYLFMLPIKYLTGFYTRDGYIEAVKGFWRGIDSGHLWFLTSLLWCMVIFAILEKLLQWFQMENVYLLLIIAVVFHLSYAYIPKDILGLKTAMEMFLWFCMGYWFEENRKNLKISKKVIVLYLMVLALIAVIFPSEILVLVWGTVTCIVAILCDVLFTKILDFSLCKKITSNLFNIYLFHDPLEYIILYVFFHSNLLETAWGCSLYMFARTIGVIVISIIMGELLSKVSDRYVVSIRQLKKLIKTKYLGRSSTCI